MRGAGMGLIYAGKNVIMWGKAVAGQVLISQVKTKAAPPSLSLDHHYCYC